LEWVLSLSLSLSLSPRYMSQFFFFGQSFTIWWIVFQKIYILSTFPFSSPKKIVKNRLIFSKRMAMFLHIVQASVINYKHAILKTEGGDKCSHF
jgi:hypothetical protein